MLKLIITVSASIVAGLGIGWLHARLSYGNYEERFLGSRVTRAEVAGEVSMSELLKSSARAKLEIEGGSQFDFGTMMHGETMSHDFIFRNIGDDPLNLEMGESTCKCTIGKLEKSILYPGDETTVTLTWTAQSISPEYGQSATIYTSDPSQTEVKLKIFGQIASSFVIEPPALSLGDFSVDESVSRKFHVFTYLEDSKGLGEFTWSDPHTHNLVNIDAEKVELDAERFPKHQNALQVHEVTFDIAPGMPLGGLGGRIQFDTDKGEDVGILEIAISGTVVGDFTLFGGASFNSRTSVVDLGTVKSSEGASVTVWLAAQGEKREKVQPKVTSTEPADALEVTIGEPTTRGNRRVFPIRFNVPKGAPEAYYPGVAGKQFGKVMINTNLEVASEVPIYVRLIVNK